MKVLVTGAAGFIGCETALQLLAQGHEVAGIDNLNDYYDVTLKQARLARLRSQPGFSEALFCLSDATRLREWFSHFRPDAVIHLAAQAGVRYSLSHPQAYLTSNLVAFGNMLECCRHFPVEHLVYASSSSVYGSNTRQPFSVSHSVDHPVSLYAATKKANELMAHSYSHLYQLPTTGLRFFTVYGPWGRPDMAPMIFCRKILAGEPLDVFNHGQHRRDFTFIDDIVDGILGVLARPPEPNPAWDAMAADPATSSAPYRIFNIGCESPVHLLEFIELLEQRLGRSAEKNMLPMQPGDVAETYADVSALRELTGYAPRTGVADGVARFVDWYLDYYGAAASRS
ncbi:MAG TPA: NAD-dependent epimerase [Haliea salexigens]|uniref:NAD-dependent epimerase n=1 Tax=Haliea salexigens TaxID=287487 RepID=A0A3C1KSI0_9GAMM|nr:NAD-dependent epimerase [Haliea salexigens]MAA88094.1 NAD-dependent epimerase [Haliea sp.]HAN29156.1 NAD-dependent epimerase [Haliea salexigens]|tara:strand:- start:14774 stop:15796 length:1023 start_codon:yes stop_codon:yes gene_type:complete